MINNLWVEHLTPATFAALPSFCLNGRSERRKIEEVENLEILKNLSGGPRERERMKITA